jgi:hypothetical protein
MRISVPLHLACALIECYVVTITIILYCRNCYYEESLSKSYWSPPPMPPHVPYGRRGFSSRLWPKCNRLLRLGRPWGAVTIRWMVVYEYEVPGGALNLCSTELPRPWSPWKSSLHGKIPMVEPGIEPGTSWSVVRNSEQTSNLLFIHQLLLHVSASMCHHQGARMRLLCYVSRQGVVDKILMVRISVYLYYTYAAVWRASVCRQQHNWADGCTPGRNIIQTTKYY